MNNKLHDILIIGASGLSLQCLPLILEKYKNPAFFDDINKNKNLFNSQFPIYHTDEFITICEKFAVCVSDPKKREILINRFIQIDGKFGYRTRLVNLVSKDFPNQISDYEHGLIVLDGCIIEPEVEIASNCLINTRCSVHHGTKLGNFVTLAPNVTLLGNCEIGDYTFIGAGTIVKEKIKIGDNCLIGMGSIVLDNIPDNSIAYGNPCKIIRENK